MDKTCLIIGAGLGGLFTGALLARNGYKVTVIEKNATIGGGLQCFRRGDKLFETGMHIMGGFQPGGNLSRICSYLGILDRLKIEHLNPYCTDRIYYGKDGKSYIIGSGRENFVKVLASQFPEEAEGIKAYVDELFDITERIPLFNLRPGIADMTGEYGRFSMPADRLIAKHVRNEVLRELLAYLNPIYSGTPGHSPAYVHALINVLFISGASRFVGGSQQLADALAGCVTDRGGEIVAGDPVQGITVENKAITSVITKSGRTFTPQLVISSIHPVSLLKILPPKTFTTAFTNRLNNIPNSFSAFSLYIDLKPDRFPYIPYTGYYLRDYGMMWNQATHEENKSCWPHGFLYMTPPEPEQGPFASRLLIHCPMEFDEVRQWQDTSTGRRGQDYLDWKQDCGAKLIDALETIYPDIRKCIHKVYTSSPLTIRDYYNVKEGSMFGYTHDSEDILYSQIPVRTKLSNLYLTGQNVMLHGICGVPLTAIKTVDAILGEDYIINQILEHERN